MEVCRHILLIAELLAFITAVLYYRKYNNKAVGLKYLPYFLGIIFVSEFGNMLSYYGILRHSIMLVVNLQIALQVLFYVCLFTANTRYKLKRLIAILSIILYLITYVFEAFYYNNFDSRMNSISFMLGAMTLIFMTLFYLAQTVKTFGEQRNVMDNPINWIALGVFVSYSIELCIFSLTNYFGDLSATQSTILHPLFSGKLLISAMMYITIAFSLSKKCRKQNS